MKHTFIGTLHAYPLFHQDSDEPLPPETTSLWIERADLLGEPFPAPENKFKSCAASRWTKRAKENSPFTSAISGPVMQQP